MQNTVRWRSDQFQPTHIWNPWSNETDANLEDSACTVRVLLFFPMTEQKLRKIYPSERCELRELRVSLSLTNQAENSSSSKLSPPQQQSVTQAAERKKKVHNKE